VFVEGRSSRSSRRKWSISSAFNAHNVKCNKATETTNLGTKPQMVGQEQEFEGVLGIGPSAGVLSLRKGQHKTHYFF